MCDPCEEGDHHVEGSPAGQANQRRQVLIESMGSMGYILSGFSQPSSYFGIIAQKYYIIDYN